MSSPINSTHILVFPFPAQGHMLPILDLTHQLLLHKNNLTITILVTPKNLPTLTPLLTTHPNSLHTLVLPFPPHPSIPSGVENVKELGVFGNLPIISALTKLRTPIIQWFRSHHNPPVAILSDFFLGWTQHLSRELNVSRIAFYSSGAFLTCVLNDLWKRIETVRALDVVDLPDLPGSPSFVADHVPTVIRMYRESNPDSEILKDGMIANTSSYGCVFNSFDALEGKYLEHLRRTTGNGRVWAVGPLLLTGDVVEKLDRVNPIPESGLDVLAWLDTCPKGSVIYVCFGSQKLLKKETIEALALGLEKSGARFIWVVKPASTEKMEQGYGSIPEGFEDRVKGRGLVIKGWSPQVAILSHSSVGGFLSHCGWNSVLESIAAGVMLLAWPMEADQYVNARLLVEDMNAAVRVWAGEKTIPDPDELAKTISQSMGEKGEERLRAKELRENALKAVGVGGSSFGSLDDLVKELGQLQLRPTCP
ncbi:UDP-glucuronosyl/UDP-glucosyltransferase [Dillenia turbinata]|uniref:UDP-glucuronosyl/UDP-glucosyltransferase n=1 Tax=Dillenia turbinata TaxID=194707 RepID=A0AAN8VQ64_9MAGN